MQIAYEVLLDTGRILALVLVSFALCISTMILLKPLWASALNRKFNTLYSTEEPFKVLDKKVSTTDAVLKNRFWIGSMLLAGSLFVTWYTLNVFDPERFIRYVIQPETRWGSTVSDIGLVSAQWLFMIVGVAGVITSLMIILNPDSFKKFSDKLDHLFSTEETVRSLEALDSSLDSWVIRHHILVGGFLFVGSVYLMEFCFQLFLK